MARVLLAEDERVLRMLVCRQLRQSGHEVAEAENGNAACSLLETYEFDVLISDMMMPGLDGMGLIERAADLAPTMEVIVLTGHGSVENAVEAFKTGNVFDYLRKPLADPRELGAAVERAAERRQLRHDNIRLVTELEGRIRELEAAKRRLQDFAERDGITGLLNHRAIHRCLDECMDDERQSVALILLDLDEFRRFNDTHGLKVGDQLLRHIGQAIRYSCAEASGIGRCGGDEFMIILPGASSQDAGMVAQNLRKHLASQPFKSPDGSALPVHVCVGISDVETAGRSSARLVASADSALYESKLQGGDTITLQLVTEEIGRAHV